jgi:hypothetical protein
MTVVYLAQVVLSLCGFIWSVPLLLGSLHVLSVIVTPPIEIKTSNDVAPAGEVDRPIVHCDPGSVLTVTVHLGSTPTEQFLKSTFLAVVVMLLAPVLASVALPSGSLEIVDSRQVMTTNPPTALNTLGAEPEVVLVVILSVTTQAFLLPVHVKDAEAAGANKHAATAMTRASSPSLGTSFIRM